MLQPSMGSPPPQHTSPSWISTLPSNSGRHLCQLPTIPYDMHFSDYEANRSKIQDPLVTFEGFWGRILVFYWFR